MFSSYDNWLTSPPEYEVYIYLDEMENELYADDIVWDVDGWISDEYILDFFIDNNEFNEDVEEVEIYTGEVLNTDDFDILEYDGLRFVEDDLDHFLNKYFDKATAEEAFGENYYRSE